VARDARDLDSASYVGHRCEKTVADLVAMGYDLEEILDNAGSSTGFELNTEAVMRNPSIDDAYSDSDDPMMQKVLYVESYIRVDKDGDGLAETRRVCTIGNAFHVLHEEIWDDMAPFAVLCPDPEPHMVIGYSMADQVADLQEIKSALVRNTLDSLASSIHPDTAVVETQVNMADVLNTEVGKIVRMRAPGMVQPLSQPFIGQAALGVIDYIDQIRAQRTGITAASQGLDPDVLQSTTKAAVSAVTQAAAQRLELIARIFAETGIRRLMKGVLRLVIRHQDASKMARLRGKFIPVDPKYWDAEMDVVINVGLGTGNTEERLAVMGVIAQKQEQLLMQTGPLNPMATVVELRNTYAKMLELAGVKDVSRYFKPVTEEQVQQYAEQMSGGGGQGGEDPTAALAQAEMAKGQMKAQTDMMRLQIEQQKALMQDDRERDKLDADIALRQADLQGKYAMQANEAEMRARMEAQRMSQPGGQG
jgi:hypothetical protein